MYKVRIAETTYLYKKCNYMKNYMKWVILKFKQFKKKINSMQIYELNMNDIWMIIIDIS